MTFVRAFAIAVAVFMMCAVGYAGIPTVQSNQVKVGADDTARVAKPVSLASGELVLLFVLSADNTAGPCFSPPSGFTEIVEYGDATIDTYIWAAYKVAGGSEPDSYFVASSCSSDEYVCWSVRVTGQHATDIVNVVGAKSTESTTDSILITGVTQTKDSCRAFYIMSFDGGDGDPFAVKTSTNTWTESAENVSGPSVNTSVGGSWGTKSMPIRGATGDCKIDAALADDMVGAIFVIRGSYVNEPDWGGAYLRSAANMDCTYLNSSSVNHNNGANVTASITVGTPSSVIARSVLIRPAIDEHTAGYTQDSGALWVYVDAAQDTGLIVGRVPKINWLEGDEFAAAADSCEATWDSAIALVNASGTCTPANWATDGAQGSGDRETVVACSVRVSTGYSAGYKRLAIAGSHLTENFFDYGLVVELQAVGNFYGMTFGADDRGVEAQRPYFEFWESPPAAGGTTRRRHLMSRKP